MREPAILWNSERRHFFARMLVNGKRRYFRLGITEKEAADRMAELLASHRRVAVFPREVKSSEIVTLQDALDAYLEKQRRNPRCGARHLENIAWHFAALASFRLGDVELGAYQVGELRAAHLTAYLDTQSLRGWGPGTLRHAAGAAKAALRYCVGEGLIEAARSPWAGVPIPAVPPSNSRAMTKAELKSILKAARGFDRLAISLLYETGARPSELSRARWDDIREGQIVLQEHKTRAKSNRPRVLYLSKRGREIVGQLPRAGPSLLPTLSNRVAWERIVQRVRKEIPGLGWVTPYTFRHSRATHLIEAGVDAKTVAMILGNSEVMVLSRYVHPAPDHVGRALEL